MITYYVIELYSNSQNTNASKTFNSLFVTFPFYLAVVHKLEKKSSTDIPKGSFSEGF